MKIGDKVKVKNDDSTQTLTAGDEGVVTKIELKQLGGNPMPWPIVVQMDRHVEVCVFDEDELEVV